MMNPNIAKCNNGCLENARQLPILEFWKNLELYSVLGTVKIEK